MRLSKLYSLFFLLLFFQFANAQEQIINKPLSDNEWLRILAPKENTIIIDKKPNIKVEFLVPIERDTLLVLLDGTDITQVLNLKENGFEYVPIFVLSSGNHVLNISLKDIQGNNFQKEILFNTRHTNSFEEVYVTDDISINYESVLKKPQEDEITPNSKIEGNISSRANIKEGAWDVSFNTNIRYLDQSKPVYYPIKKGFQIANWLFKTIYSKNSFLIRADIGDVQVNETQYTVTGLSRRGGTLNLKYDSTEESYEINLFTVKGYNVFGFSGGFGFSSNTNDHIIGVSGGIKIFEKKIELKTIYVNGGEPGSSFGISTATGSKKGDVIGFLFLTNLFKDRLKTEIETDFSKFDPDTSDEFRGRNDRAHRFKIGGYLGRYSYEAIYEYIGRDYVSVANQCLQKDKQGITFLNNISLNIHNVNLILSRYNDNVRGDRLFPRIINYQGSLDYSFNKFPSFPIGLNYQKSIQNSSREPNAYSKIKIYTDTISGRINYIKDKINLGFQTSYSFQNDKTPNNYDTSTITYTFVPSYNETNVSLAPSFSFNQSKNHYTDVRTDTYTINLDVRTKFFKERASFDIGGTYNIAKSSDDSIDNKSLGLNFRVAYNIKKLLKGYINPIIALRTSYNKYIDNINKNLDKDEFYLFLVLSTTIPFSI